MKTSRLFLLCFFFISLICNTSCVQDDYLLEETTSLPFNISEAQLHLTKRINMTTRTDMLEYNHSGFYYGDFNVDWSTAHLSTGNILYNIETQFNSDYKYAYQIDDKIVKIHSQLVSVKNKENNLVKTYIKTFIPTFDYAQTHTMSDMRSIQNTGTQDDFSGLIVYSSIEGVPLYVSQIYNGLSHTTVSAFDLSHTKWENYEAIKYMLSKYNFVEISTNVTRSDNIDYIIGIDQVVISAKKNVSIFKQFDEIRARELEDSCNVDYDSVTGGGGSSNRDGEYWDGNNPTKDISKDDKTNKIFLFDKKWNNVIIKSDTKEHVDSITNILDRLNDISIFQTIQEDLENKNITVIIEYNPECPYEGLLRGEDDVIEIKNLSGDGFLFEEFIHKYQFANEKPNKTIDAEYEAKCIFAKMDECNIFSCPTVIDDYTQNQEFWNYFFDIIANPTSLSNILNGETAILEVYAVPCYGQSLSNGKNLKNYHRLF